MKHWAILLLCGLPVSFLISGFEASAQDYAGPLRPHVGAQITTAFANRYGPDAEAYFTFTAVTPQLLSLNYSSTRGLNTRRNIRMTDLQSSQTYVLGHAANMPADHAEHYIARYLGNVARVVAQYRQNPTLADLRRKAFPNRRTAHAHRSLFLGGISLPPLPSWRGQWPTQEADASSPRS